MWDGARPGPRGGPPLRGDPRGEMFNRRECPEFRGRESMPMGHRPPDRPPIDMRRFDRPSEMRPREMEPSDIRGRDPHREFFRPGEEGDMGMRKQYEMEMRNKLQGPPNFMGPVRHPLDMSGRDMKPRGMREGAGPFVDRDRFRSDMPGFNEPPMDSRRRHPMNIGGRDEGFRDAHERDRPRMVMKDGFNMDVQPREREMMDFERRNAPPLNPRTRFESDMDFRNRMRPPAEFRDRSPQRFGENDGAPMDVRGRTDIPPDFGGLNRSKFRGGEGNFREQQFPEQREAAVGLRGGEGEPSPDEWHGRDMRERGSFVPHMKGGPPFPKGRERLPPPRGREGGPADPPKFPGGERPPVDFPADGEKSYGFRPPGREGLDSQNWEKNAPPEHHFPGRDLAPYSRKGLQDPPRHHFDTPPLNASSRDNDNKVWPREQDQSIRGRPPYLRGMDTQGKNLDPHGPDNCASFDGPKDLTPNQGPERGNLSGGQKEFPDNGRDQDYRDIDYRTGSGHTYEYELGEDQGTENTPVESKSLPPQGFSDSVSQDQDYRNASVQEKVSNTISITGIPKTATMEQILGAFAVRDGVPMQGMKIKNVVPGYSYDTAYVEFLNLEDAVHFMESNQGALKVGTKTALMRYIQPEGTSIAASPARQKDAQPLEPPLTGPPPINMEPPEMGSEDGQGPKLRNEAMAPGQWQRSSSLTPEAWQQQVDQQLQQQKQAESLVTRNLRPPLHPMDPIFKESKTMIIKNVKPTTTVETILKALDPYAYLDERNVRLVKGKPLGTKCFCFVDMDSNEQVTRLVEILTKPPPLIIDGVRVYVEVAKPLKNQNYRREFDKSGTSLLGYPPDVMEQYYGPPAQVPLGSPAIIQGEPLSQLSRDNAVAADPHLNANMVQVMPYAEPPAADGSFPGADPQGSGAAVTPEGADAYSYAAEAPDMSSYLYDATSGFYYDPQTTLYYDPSSRYFYNAQTQQYLYWDTVTKAYIPVPGYTTDTQPPVAQAGAPVVQSSATVVQTSATVVQTGAPVVQTNSTVVHTATAVAAVHEPQVQDAQQEVRKNAEATSEKKEEDDPAPRAEKKEKEDKPRSLAAFKIMKDMERWAKIQNRQKESVRVPSPVLKTPGGVEERKTSKAADAAFAIFERKGTAGEDLFKKPLAPPKKEEKSKRPMGSLELLVADYGAGSDEEEEEKHEPARTAAASQPEEKEDKLTDWKKMACLLCRRQFPNKDALVRHQQLSDLHKQNMEIHLKIKRSKKELEALENQEKQLNTRERDLSGSPEFKRKKYQNTWSSGSREMHKVGERPGLGAETMERKKKEPVVWNHATYKQAVRKAMFARFKELE
uniref:RNA-binding protein 6-like n=1 Tax=Paramormyrops kingsleyae TaxID=1676925 RepID=A0A3B3QVA9_9TELE|nr:RNA-binding protein 6-like isoform X1 [Paramormyrops kingsleyae]XP_023661270.1 RNA-binding protein 6-like isoform X1 [Paramormyrops kingsleyae]